MQKVCKVCNRNYTVNTMGRDLKEYIIPVCSISCFIEYLKGIDRFTFENERLVNPVPRPFQSNLEYVFFMAIKPHFEILYEPYILRKGKYIYIPDFYLPEKNLFIELKGSKERISKFKKFAKTNTNLFILFPEVVKGAEL